MYKITHIDPTFILNQATFPSLKEAEAHMKLIKRYCVEWVVGGMLKADADTYYAAFTVTEVK